MHPYCLEILRSCYQRLVSELQLDGTALLQVLVEHSVLTPAQCDSIKSVISPAERTYVLLAHLRRCPPEHKPFLRFVQALEETQPALATFVKDTANNGACKDRLRILMLADVCTSCIIKCYLDPKEAVAELRRDGLIGSKAYHMLQDTNHLPNTVLVESLLRSFYEWPSEEQRDVIRCLTKVLGKRGPQLARRVHRTVTSLDSLEICSCVGACSDQESPLVPFPGRIHGFVVPGRADVGNKVGLHALSRVSSELMRFLWHGQWQDFKKYSRLVNEHFSDDRNMCAVVLAYEILSLHCTGQTDDSVKRFSDFSDVVKGASCEPFLSLQFSLFRANICRAADRIIESHTVAEEALQSSQLLSYTTATALLHVVQGTNLLHRRNPHSSDIGFPSYDASEMAVTCMRMALHVLERVDTKTIPRVEGWHTPHFWPLLTLVFVRLGSCMTGKFFNPGSVHPDDWAEIEQAVQRLQRDFDVLPPSHRMHFCLMYADYVVRLTESKQRMGSREPRDLLLIAKDMADRALRLAKRVKPAFQAYAQRRLNAIEAKLSAGISDQILRTSMSDFHYALP